jgi:MFS family permease
LQSRIHICYAPLLHLKIPDDIKKKKVIMVSEKAHASSRIFYGWYVMAASFFLLFFQSGARYSFGIMFKPMMAEFGWNRASISSVFFLNMVFFALTLTVAGRLYDRYGPRWVIFSSTVLLAAGYMCTALVRTLWQFHIFYGVLTAIGTGGATIPLVAALISKWFEKRRGLTISLALSGACLGQFILVPIFNQFVLIYSWRISYFLIGLIILVVNTILAFTVIKGDPDDLGVQPYGRADSENRVDPDGSVNSVHSESDLNLKQAMKTYSLWLFLVFMFICGGGDFLIVAHLVPFVTDYGVSPTSAANMLALFGLMSLGGILIAGPASDLIGNKIPIAASFVLRLLLFVMILKYRIPISFYIFAGGFGFTFLITAPLTATLAGRLYGFAHLGLISGFITTIHHLGGGFWAYTGGLLFDRTGNYQIILAVSAVLAAIATICAIAIKEKRHLIR